MSNISIGTIAGTSISIPNNTSSKKKFLYSNITKHPITFSFDNAEASGFKIDFSKIQNFQQFAELLKYAGISITLDKEYVESNPIPDNIADIIL